MNQYSLLKNIFLINGFLSAITGLICLFLSDYLSTLSGNISSLYLEVIGGGLVVFGSLVFFIGKKEKPNLMIANIIFYLDVVWVLGTTGLLALFFESIHIRYRSRTCGIGVCNF